MLPSRLVPKARAEMIEWIDQWQYTRFVTLAFNDNSTSDARLPGSQLNHGRLRDRLVQWDARMNRLLIGKEWASRYPNRMFAFWFLEKPTTNPHWHGLVRFFPLDAEHLEQQETKFDRNAERLWTKLVPSGSVDVQNVSGQRNLVKYVAKSLGHELSFEHFVTADEFAQR